MKTSIIGATVAILAVIALGVAGCTTTGFDIQPPECVASTYKDQETGRYKVVWSCNDGTTVEGYMPDPG